MSDVSLVNISPAYLMSEGGSRIRSPSLVKNLVLFLVVVKYEFSLHREKMEKMHNQY